MVARKAILASLRGTDKTSNIGFGCSGGADSLALLAALSTIYHGDFSRQVHVIIVDHQLQEITSEISKNVSSLAKSYGFTPVIIPVDIASTSDGMESDARKARYNAFEEAIQKYSLKSFLIGHTKTDQAEQVFLGLLRGSGTRSLAGIRENRGIYKRPFLNSMSREDTQKVCEENNLDYWCDPHNDVLEYKRVSVRKMIKNVEKSTGQDIVNPLVRTAQISAEDAEALDFYAEMAYEKAEQSDWTIEVLSKMPVAVRKRIYRTKMIAMGTKTDTVGFDMVNKVDDFIVNWHGQKHICASNNVRIKRVKNKLVFEN